MKHFIQSSEIPARKVTIENATENDFNHIKEVVIDYFTAHLLLTKGKPVYTKTVETANGTIKTLFVVKVSSRHYMEFLESTIL
jgi:hypothetical protein